MTDVTRDSHRLRRAAARWCAYERQEADSLAEDALLQVFALLPVPAPSVGFADRVVAALRPVSWIDRAAAHWGVRAAALLVLVQTTLMLGALGITAVVLGQHYGLDSLLVFAAQAGVSAMSLAGAVLDWLGVLGGVAQTLARALSSPAVLAVALGCTAVAALALYSLVRGTSSGLGEGNRRKRDVGTTAA